jgi:pentose-5-phosphate-3-epimerase
VRLLSRALTALMMSLTAPAQVQQAHAAEPDAVSVMAARYAREVDLRLTLPENEQLTTSVMVKLDPATAVTAQSHRALTQISMVIVMSRGVGLCGA